METDDIVAIRMLTDRYSDAANRADFPAMAAVYTEDAELISFGNRFNGRAAIEKVFAETVGALEFVNQICAAGVIDVKGDRATARWSVTEFVKRRGKDQLEIFIGTYEDEAVRTPQGWLFSRRVLSERAKARLDVQFKRQQAQGR